MKLRLLGSGSRRTLREGSLVQSEGRVQAPDKGERGPVRRPALPTPSQAARPPSVAAGEAPLRAAVEIAARAADDGARGRRAPAADRAADARAERRAAGGRADGARARLEVAPRGLAVEGVGARAARADGRALLAAGEPADGRAARDDRRRPRLTPEARTLPRLRRRVERQTRHEE